ncbi:hypothetical protein Pcinc_017507 [Petrolisthes cinctipes]|uniref:Uncharacterized protein n=1 Tax=Petrolisthes cinctipes TaxID=88211 RepID=A0AAE1FRC3_PETCI|nr:hypothetical protein Pcinc_017507 [Petrolisthes cinctipes]
MGRVCVVCQGPGKNGRTVFPFPRSHEQRAAWLTALPILPITSVEGWSPGRKYGVCDRHFLSQDVLLGPKTSLTDRAVPVTELCLQTPHTEMPQSRLRALLTELDQSRLQAPTPTPRQGLRLNYITSPHTAEMRQNQTAAFVSRKGNSTGRNILVGDVNDTVGLGSEGGTGKKEERGKVGTGRWQVDLTHVGSELTPERIEKGKSRIDKLQVDEGEDTGNEGKVEGKARERSITNRCPGEEGNMTSKVGAGVKRKGKGVAGRRPVKKAQKFDPTKGMAVVNPCVLPDKLYEASSENELLMPEDEVHHNKNSPCENNNTSNTCLVCGKRSGALGLVCVLRVCKVSNITTSLGALVARIVGRSKREVTNVSAKMCSRCLSLIQEVVKIEQHLKTKKHIIRDMFETTFQNQCEKTKVDMKGSQNKDSTLSKEHCETDCTTTLVTDSITSVAGCKEENTSDNYVPAKIESDDTRKSSRRKASVKNYQCPHCKEEFTGLALWVQHLFKHSDGEDGVYEDETKTKTVPPKVKKKSKPLNNPCDKCGKLFSTKRGLHAHASEHAKRSDCLVCGRFLTTRARLKAHLFKFHGIGEEKVKRVKCYSCGKLFGTVAGLRYHVNVVHHIGPKYVCEHCKKVFHYHVPYRSHMLYNHGEKKVVCQTCGEKFFTISKLNTHINAVHRGAQSWTCNKCEDKFTTHTAYRHHMNIKHLRVQHTCSYCKSQFRKRSSLLTHLTKHSIHTCRDCGETFFCNDALRTHMSVTHGKEMSIKGKRKQQQNIQQTNQQHMQQSHQCVQQQQQQGQQVQQQNQEQQQQHVTSIVINDLLMTAVEIKSSDHLEMGTDHIEIPAEHLNIPSEHIIEIPAEHIAIPPEHIDIPPEGLELRAKDIQIPPRHMDVEIPSEHVEMTTVHMELPTPHQHIEMQSDHTQVRPEVAKMGSDHIDLKSEHIDMKTEHVKMGSENMGMSQRVSLINVQILGEMEDGEEVPLGSEQVMLTQAAHQLAIPTHLTEDDLEGTGHGCSHSLEESGHSLDVSDHGLEAQGHSHTLEVSGHALVSSPVLETSSDTLEPSNSISDHHSHALEATTVTTLKTPVNSHSLESHSAQESPQSTSLDTQRQQHHTLVEDVDEHHHLSPHPMPSPTIHHLNHPLPSSSTHHLPPHPLNSPSIHDLPPHPLTSPSTHHHLNHPLPSPSTHHLPPHPLPSSCTPHHCSPLQPVIVAQVEGKGDGGGAEGGGGSTTGVVEQAKVELQPLSLTMDNEGEVKYQYVMYIAAPDHQHANSVSSAVRKCYIRTGTVKILCLLYFSNSRNTN